VSHSGGHGRLHLQQLRLSRGATHPPCAASRPRRARSARLTTLTPPPPPPPAPPPSQFTPVHGVVYNDRAPADSAARSGASSRAGDGAVKTRQPFALTWALKEKLGKGQYATVYRVVHNVTGFEAAVKCILKAPLTKEDLEALAIEVKAMQLLRDNKNFVKCAPPRGAPRAARGALNAPLSPSPFPPVRAQDS